MGAIVNRELRQRVRPVNGLTVHKVVARQDIKHAAKIIQLLDNRWQLWKKKSKDVEAKKEDSSKDVKENDDENKKEEDEKNNTEDTQASNTDNINLGFISENPVLRNITDFLVDEVDYEDELLGVSSKEKDATAEVTIERDEELLKVFLICATFSMFLQCIQTIVQLSKCFWYIPIIVSQVLDRMLLYLRVVYSIDYYGAFEYQNEDDMPHRCGIIHARGLNTTANITNHDGLFLY